MERLPEALKIYVASFVIHSRDLASLSLTSSSLFDCARLSLYQKVALRSDLPSARDTIALILRNRTLRKAIRTIYFKTDEVWAKHPPVLSWIDNAMFQGMDKLRKVAFDRLPCSTGHLFQDLIAAIYAHCPELDEFIAVEIRWPLFRPKQRVALVTHLTVRPSLKRLTFRTSFAPGNPLLRTMTIADCISDMKMFLPLTFFTPQTRLESLDLSVERNSDALEAVSGLCFPHLTTLKITGFSDHSSRTLIRFLSAHSSIQAASFLRSETLVLHATDINILPNLRSISGPPAFISALSAICDKVKYVEVLNLNYYKSPNVSLSTTLMVHSIGGFPNLKHFSVERYLPNFADSLVHLLRASRDLQWWTGGFLYRHPDTLSSAMLEMATTFPSLKRIDICVWATPVPLLYDLQRESLRRIAARMPSLEKIFLFSDGLSFSNEIVGMHVVQRMALAPHEVDLIGPYQDVEYLQHVALDGLDWEHDPILERTFPFA
ncbi:hypothetical protein CVT26_010835 [Gymnopilus dilepis]|uniref:F-box domain-containing protein n=1 Tax=Gymnopilus dilepis TaxID=231916 RepID=A0A409VY29_9AGAR|nr:hypothetical protein CVT26_010835 [Gymnopilus dilepis]